MKGSDLRCPACGSHASDVDPNLDLDPGPGVKMHSIGWTCTGNHQNFIDLSRTDDYEVYIAREETSGLSINEWTRVIGEWADRQFPDRTIMTSISKLVMEEIPEFIASRGKEPNEFADLIILIMDVAHQAGVDVEAALAAKHRKNLARSWKKNDMGVYHHEN